MANDTGSTELLGLNLKAEQPRVMTARGQFVEQHKTLISAWSRSRASQLIRLAGFGTERGRVINYYVAEPDEPLPRSVTAYVLEAKRNIKPNEEHPLFTAQSRAIPANERMQFAIALAMDDFNKKMSGIVRLSPTTNPAMAHILIAGSENGGFGGITSGQRRIVLLDVSAFNTKIASENQLGTAAHEIGHALGLEHPHNYKKDVNAPSSDRVGCARTVMAYTNKCLGNNGVPAFLWQDLDMRALKELYAPRTPAVRQRQEQHTKIYY